MKTRTVCEQATQEAIKKRYRQKFVTKTCVVLLHQTTPARIMSDHLLKFAHTRETPKNLDHLPKQCAAFLGAHKIFSS
jgi:vancomycin permeability regulator SanA